MWVWERGIRKVREPGLELGTPEAQQHLNLGRLKEAMKQNNTTCWQDFQVTKLTGVQFEGEYNFKYFYF